jgi:gas vesicle protein
MDENKGLSYFFLGLGLGVAAGMLFAPKTGMETRSLLRDRALEGGDYLKRQGENLRESAEDLVQRGKEMVGKQREQLGAAVDAGRQAYRETVTPGGAPMPTTPGEGI